MEVPDDIKDPIRFHQWVQEKAATPQIYEQFKAAHAAHVAMHRARFALSPDADVYVALHPYSAEVENSVGEFAPATVVVVSTPGGTKAVAGFAFFTDGCAFYPPGEDRIVEFCLLSPEELEAFKIFTPKVQ